MENVGSIEYEARINTKNLKSDAQEADRIAKDTGNSLGDNTESGTSRAGTALAAFGSIAKTAALAAGVALAGGIAAAAKASWDQVGAVEQATVGLKAYEKDGSKVNQVLSDLLKYAKSDLGVLFNRKDLYESAQALKIMGDNTDALVGHVQILSRSVGLGLSNWEDLNTIVGRVGKTGRLTGDDFDNLAKAGYSLDPALRNTNITFDALFKALDKGIPVDAMEGQASTIKGIGIRFETAFRGIGNAILGVDKDTNKFKAGSLGQGIVDSIKAVTDFLKRDDVAAVVGGIGMAIVTAFTFAGNAITTFSNAIAPLANWFRIYLLPIIQQAASLIGGVFAESWKQLSTLLAPFSEQLKVLGGIILFALITPVLLAVTALVAITVTITAVVTAVAWLIGKLAELANFMVTTGAAAGTFFGTALGQAVNNIKSVFGSLYGFFQGIWNSIVGLFSSVGTTVGNAIGNTFKSVINAVLRGAVNLIDGFINSLNAAVDVINKIPGVKINKIGTLPIPQLAAGGIVTSPTLAMIGEGHQSEAVIPLDKLEQMIGGGARNEYNIGTINIAKEADGEAWLKKLTQNQEIVSKGLTPQTSY